MPITVTMIEEKEFKTSVRGYDKKDVDEFLDEICDEMISQQDTIAALREKVKQLESAASFAPPAPAPALPLAPTVAPRANVLPVDIESAQKLLAETQRACDETMADAKKRADSIIEDAHKLAEEIAPDPGLTDLEAKRDAVREEIETLKKEMDAFRARMKSLLTNQSDLLETETF